MRTIFTTYLILLFFAAFGQKENPLIRKGNESFKKGDHINAEKLYKEALTKNKSSEPAAFNLGDALYKQEKYEEAQKQFQSVVMSKSDEVARSKVYHNIGNSLLQQKKYEESIKAYKQALKLDPRDEDTRYNLAYAQAKLQQQQNKNQQNKDNKDQKDKQDKKDEKKDEQKKNDEQKQDDKKDQNDQQKKEEKNGQPEKPQMSEQDAKRMLEAINQEDKKIQDKLKKEKAKGREVRIEKDW